jgi:hypothetical protein
MEITWVGEGIRGDSSKATRLLETGRNNARVSTGIGGSSGMPRSYLDVLAISWGDWESVALT